MATRLVPSIALAIGLSHTASHCVRAQAPSGAVDEVRNQFLTCRIQVRNLAAAIRGRLDEADAGAGAGRGEMRRRGHGSAKRPS